MSAGEAPFADRPRFGVLLFTSRFAGPSESQMLDGTLRYAETAGVDHLWVGEHPSSPTGSTRRL